MPVVSRRKPKISDLKLSAGQLAMAKDFVEDLGIGFKDDRYFYALLWFKNHLKADGDVLSQSFRKRFDTETQRRKTGSDKVGAIHLKILAEIAILETQKPDNSRRQQTSSSTNSTLRSRQAVAAAPQRIPVPTVELTVDKDEVEKGDSYTISWKSENAKDISRSSGFPNPIPSDELSGSRTLIANRTGTKSFSISVSGRRTVRADVKITIVEVKAGTSQSTTSTNQSASTRLSSTVTRISRGRQAFAGGQALSDINKSLLGIIQILKLQNKFVKTLAKVKLKEEENERRKKKENLLESSKNVRTKAMEKVLSPIKSIFEKIWNFIVYTLLGRAFTEFLNWFNDPKNEKKVKALGRFLKDFWPLIAGAAAIFLTPLYGFIKNTIKLISWFTKSFNKLIPRFKLILSGPLGQIAAILGLAALANEVTGQRKAAKIQTEQAAKVKSGKALEIPGVDIMNEKYKTPGISGRVTPGLLEGVATGGLIDNGTGIKIRGAGKDTQLTALTPGEIVMNTQAVKAIGAEKLLALNSLFGGSNANKPKKINPEIIGLNTGGMVGYKTPGIKKTRSKNQTLNPEIIGLNTGGMVGYKTPGIKKTRSKNQEINPRISQADYNALLAISAAEDYTNPQGRADVAQSIYNRLYAANKYGLDFGASQNTNTIKNIITGEGQFQPTFKNKNDWLNIKDRKSAAIAFANYKGISVEKATKVLSETDKILRNPVYQRKAQNHVQGRTYFLGSSQHKNMKPEKGDVVRSPKHNFFSHWYTDGSKYQKEKGNIAAPLPRNVLPSKINPVTKVQNKKQTPVIIKENPLTNVARLILGFPKSAQANTENLTQNRLKQQKENIIKSKLKSQKVSLVPAAQPYQAPTKLLPQGPKRVQNPPIKRPWWDPRGFMGKRSGGLITADQTTINVRSDDRHPILVQAGEYVVPKLTVQKLGVNFFDQIVSKTDRSSEAAKFQPIPRKEEIMPPMKILPSVSQIMSLPPILSQTPVTPVADGNEIPTFPSVSPMGNSTRQWLATEIYNIV